MVGQTFYQLSYILSPKYITFLGSYFELKIFPNFILKFYYWYVEMYWFLYVDFVPGNVSDNVLQV